MRIMIMGAGAVGGYFGGVLTRSGADVTLIARGEHYQMMSRHGLVVKSSTSGDFVTYPKVVQVPDGSWKANLILFCVKAYHNTEAIKVMSPAVGSQTSILTLQNGLGSGDQLTEAFDQNLILQGVTYLDATKTAAGIISEHGGRCSIVFGELDEPHGDQSTEILRQLRSAGINATMSHQIEKDIWSKLIYICALSGMTCITRSTFSEILDTPETLALTERLMHEVEDVARAKGVALNSEVVDTILSDFQTHKHNLVSSMYTDLKNGLPLEVQVLNGAVSRMGKAVKVPTPINDFIASCLKLIGNKIQT